MSVIIKRVWNQNKMVNIEALQGMAFQAEDGGHTFEISGVDDEGNAVPLSGTVAGVFMRPDKADIALVGTASGGVVSVTLSDACYSVTGKFGLTIFVTDGNNKKTAVYAGVGTVASTNGGAVAGDTPQDVVDLINAIEAAVATIPADYTDLMAAIAPVYSNSALYAVGAYAWQDGKLYRSIIPITTAETWTAAHWTAAVIGNDVSDLKSVSDEVLEILEHPISYSKADVPMSAYFTTIIDCVQLISGTRYDISATLASSATQAYYLILYKGETSVKSITIASGSTSGTFYYDVTETGNDYSVKAASGAYAAHVGVSATVVPRTNGSVIDTIPPIQEKQKLNSTIINNATTKRYLSANMYDGEHVANKYVNKDGTVGNSNSYGYTKNLIRVNDGNNITIGDGSAIRTMRFVTAYGADYEPISAKGAESVDAYVVPSGVKFIRISAAIGYFQGDYFTVQNSAALLPYDTYNAEDVPIDSRTYHDKHFVVSSNLFDGEYISGKGIKQDGTLFGDNNYGVTKNFIPVDAGDDIVATSNNGIRFMRYIAAYDRNYKVLPDKGLSSGTYSYWTVPDGVYYIKVTSQATDISANDYAIYRSKGLVFQTPDTYSIVETDNRDLLRIKREPLRLMPDYITDTLAYRPVGSLSKGYICMITDDGTAGLASYTIPLAISENIPMTFAVMKGSEVFADASMTATVLDAVNNHNCSLAQHGGTLWDLMSEIDLNNYFDNEKAYFDTLGVELKGAVIPQHRTNSLVKAIAGARFGVVRSGYTGLGPGSGGDVDNGSIRNYYDYYTSGARSNIYGLSSYNCAYASTAYNRAAADYAKANNKIMVVYFHEFDTYAEQQAVVEDLISYAKSIGLEFITLGDIPSLETWDGVTS